MPQWFWKKPSTGVDCGARLSAIAITPREFLVLALNERQYDDFTRPYLLGMCEEHLCFGGPKNEERIGVFQGEIVTELGVDMLRDYLALKCHGIDSL